MTTLIQKIRNGHPHIDFDNFDRKYSLFERRVKSIWTRLWENRCPLTLQIAENKISGPIPLDPHEKVSMDAEKIMSGSWDFEFMVKQTLKKLARTTKFHITLLGSLIATIYKPRKSSKGLKGTPGPRDPGNI